MSRAILITGATGLVGSTLSDALRAKNYIIHALSRTQRNNTRHVKYFKWDPERNKVDEKCLSGVDTIVHLAGENIAAVPWRNERRQMLVKSRTDSIRLIYSLLRNSTHEVKTVISASASGYYGDRADDLLQESDRPGTDFLAHCCLAWETAVNEGEPLGLRLVKLRTGLVLSSSGGALPLMTRAVRIGVGAPLGSGNQWMPWIHIRDLVNMYIYAIEHADCSGAFNLCSPRPVRNKEFLETLALTLKKRIWLPHVPKFLLRAVLGEMHTLITNSARMSCRKIEETGFEFNFDTLDSALRDIYE